jgi:flagellin-specific chaperone FliS
VQTENAEYSRETGAQSASDGNTIRMRSMLLDQVVQDVSRACDAIRRRQPEASAREIGHAIAVFGYLQASLPRNANSETAHALGRFYTTMREQLMEGQVRSSCDILESVREQIIQAKVRRGDLSSDDKTDS